MYIARNLESVNVCYELSVHLIQTEIHYVVDREPLGGSRSTVDCEPLHCKKSLLETSRFLLRKIYLSIKSLKNKIFITYLVSALITLVKINLK